MTPHGRRFAAEPPRPGVEPESMRGRPPRGMRANAPDTYARPRSAMPIKPVSPAGFQTPFHGPAPADRRADGARVELARGFRPNSLSGTAPLPHGPPSMPVFRRAGTPGEALTFCELSRRMRVPRQSSCAPPPGFGPEPHARLRRAMGTAGRGLPLACVFRTPGHAFSYVFRTFAFCAWWSRRDSNPRPPRCERGALPLGDGPEENGSRAPCRQTWGRP